MMAERPDLDELERLFNEASLAPWTYRPGEYDDWGTIRSANGHFAAVSRAVWGDDRTHDDHRRAGTDPYERNGKLIVALVNAAPALIASAREGERLRDMLNAPELRNFAGGVVREAVHQVERWGSKHDAGKTHADWFWLVGFLAGKAFTAALIGDLNRAQHHCISTAAALANWHRTLSGEPTAMRPGIVPPEGIGHD